MADWIKMRCDLHDEPEVIGISRRLKLDPSTVVGKLLVFWSWANRVSTDGRVPHVGREFIDQLCRRKGFAAAMIEVGWLTENDTGITVPKFERHNGQSAKARALDAERKRSVRDLSGSDPDKNRTGAGPEKRREEKSKEKLPPNPPPGGDGAETLPPIPPSLDTKAFGDAWRRWVRHKQEKRNPVTPISVAACFEWLAEIGHDRAITAINHSVVSGWDSIHEASGRRSGGALQPGDPGFLDGVISFGLEGPVLQN